MFSAHGLVITDQKMIRITINNNNNYYDIDDTMRGTKYKKKAWLIYSNKVSIKYRIIILTSVPEAFKVAFL